MIAAGLQVGPSEDVEDKKKKPDNKKRGKKSEQKVAPLDHLSLRFHPTNLKIGGRRETSS